MKEHVHIVGAILALLIGAGARQTAPASDFPLRSTVNGRHLEDQEGAAFLVHADTPWSLFVALTTEEVSTYLEDRRLRGFNTLIANTIEHEFEGAANTFGAPFNRYGEGPFTSAGDFATPNEAYWGHVDWVIDQAAAKGLLLMLTPCYVGFPGTSQGWYNELVANGATKCQDFGRWIGDRYKDKGNIVWVMFGDYNADATITPLMDAMAAGILESDTSHLITGHMQRGNSARSRLEGKPWLTLNTAYTSDIVQTQCLAEYARLPAMPFVLFEARYENEAGTTTATLRRQAYSALLSGACGHAFGNNPIWLFNSDWETALGGAGSVSMTHVRALMESRVWTQLVPDSNHAVITAGFGSTSSYVASARTADGSTVLAYLPDTAAMITVDMTQISGSSARAWWYNPRDGSAALLDTYTTTGTRDFTRPDGNDWVLVLDDASVPLPLPGAAPEILQIGTASLPNGNLNVPYSADLQASGGIPPYTWSLDPASEALPAGLSLSPDGTLSGLPAAAALANLTFKVTDALGMSVSAPVSLAILGDTSPTITSHPADIATTAGQVAVFTVAATGDPSPFEFQWQVLANGSAPDAWVDVSDGGSLSGATTSTLTVASTTVAMSGNRYRCVVGNGIAPDATSAPATLTVIKATATVTLSNLDQDYDGSPRVATASTVPPGLPVDITYNGSSSPPTNAGTYTVLATVADPDYSGAASDTLTVAKAVALVSLAGQSHVFDGTPKPVVVATVPAGLLVDVTYDGSVSPPSAAGTYAVVAAVNDSNFTGSATGTLSIARAPATVVLGNLAQTYDGGPKPVTVVTTPPGLPVDITYNGSISPPSLVGSYAVLATVNAPNHTGSATGTLSIGTATASVTLGNLNQVYDGSPRSVSVGTDPAGLATAITYDGSATGPFGAGTYSVVATVTEPGYTGSVSGTLVIAKAAAGVSISGISHVYDGTLKPVVVSSTPAGLNVDVTYDGAAAPPSQVGAYAVVATVNEPNHAGSSTATLFIDAATATISLGLLNQVYDATPRSITTATNPPGLAVAVTYNGSSVAPTNAGTYPLVATIADPNHTGSVSGTLVIAKASALVTLSALAHSYDGTAKSAEVGTMPSGLATNVTYDGSSEPPVNMGTYQVVATVDEINHAGTFSGTLVIGTPSEPVAFFGSFAPNDGDWSLWLEPSGKATFIGWIASLRKCFVESTSIDDVGAFAISTTGFASGMFGLPSSASSGIESPLSDTILFTLEGRINGRTLTGTLAGSNATFGGELEPPSGPATGYAGWYHANQLYSASGDAYAIVGPSGRIVAVVLSDAFVDGAGGGLGTGGIWATATANEGASLSLALGSADRTISVSVTPSGSNVTMGFAGLGAGAHPTDRLVNISTRGHIGTGDAVMIAGFAVQGTEPERVLVRVVGPGLAPFFPPVEQSKLLSDPTLVVYRHESAQSVLIDENDSWDAAPNSPLDIASAADAAGAFALESGSRDAALLLDLPPGLYSAVARGAGDLAGVALVEVYEIPTNGPGSPELINVSTRGVVGMDDSVLVAGFVVTGNTPKRVLIRGVGAGLLPYLAPEATASVLSDARIDLYESQTATSVLRTSNDQWESDGHAELVLAASEQAGAFPIPTGGTDAALLVHLSPGVYSAVCSGVGGATGIAIVEVYEVP